MFCVNCCILSFPSGFCLLVHSDYFAWTVHNFDFSRFEQICHIMVLLSCNWFVEVSQNRNSFLYSFCQCYIFIYIYMLYIYTALQLNRACCRCRSALANMCRTFQELSWREAASRSAIVCAREVNSIMCVSPGRISGDRALQKYGRPMLHSATLLGCLF